MKNSRVYIYFNFALGHLVPLSRRLFSNCQLAFQPSTGLPAFQTRFQAFSGWPSWPAGLTAYCILSLRAGPAGLLAFSPPYILQNMQN